MGSIQQQIHPVESWRLGTSRGPTEKSRLPKKSNGVEEARERRITTHFKVEDPEDFLISPIAVIREICRANDNSQKLRPEKQTHLCMLQAYRHSRRKQVPSQASASTTMMLVDQGRRTGDLSKLLFTFDEVDWTILGWVAFQLKKSS